MAHIQLDPLPRNATPGEILRFVATLGKLDGKRIGKIALLGNGARVEIPDASVNTVLKALDGATFRERNVRARLSGRPLGGPSHFTHLAKLLDCEAEAERQRVRELAKRGDASEDGTTLTALVLTEEDTGLGGRLLLTFVRVNRHEPLPPNRLGPGTPVLLTQCGTNRPASHRGVICDRSERTIQVAFDQTDLDLPDDATWRLDLAADEKSRQRQLAALARAGAAEKDRLAALRAVLLGEKEPEFDEPASPLVIAKHLNEPQTDAVHFALTAKDVAVIHGPPGTGKTTTVVEVIRQAVIRGDKVLACAPSNAAVDNLLEKLLAVGVEPVRLGHPARVMPGLRDRVLDILVESHPDARLARKYGREARALFRKAEKWTKAKPIPGEKQSLRAEAKQLLADARRVEQLAVERVLDAASVIGATLTGVDSETLGQRRFDLIVIDEACQSTEPASWIPLLYGDRVVLAGDPCQLPPTILSPEAADEGLAISLMERVQAIYGSKVSRLLTVQYRMHQSIMAFSSGEFYNGDLVADESVIGHRLADLPEVRAEPLTENPMQFIDTAGAGYDEVLDEETRSRFNPQEAGLAVKAVRRLLDAGVPDSGIAVITPYSAQAKLIREQLRGTGVEVDSVDGFQGREKEAVVISLVRSNPEGEIGFLSDVRRTNVALTRARRKLIVIGDSATLANHSFYKRLLEYIEQIGAYSSVWEEPL